MSQPGSQNGYGAPSRRTNTLALISLIAGILGVSFLPFAGSIVAVATGVVARRQIAETGEDGAGFAAAGRIMGWVGIFVGLFLLLLVAVPLLWVTVRSSTG